MSHVFTRSLVWSLFELLFRMVSTIPWPWSQKRIVSRYPKKPTTTKLSKSHAPEPISRSQINLQNQKLVSHHTICLLPYLMKTWTLSIKPHLGFCISSKSSFFIIELTSSLFYIMHNFSFFIIDPPSHSLNAYLEYNVPFFLHQVSKSLNHSSLP